MLLASVPLSRERTLTYPRPVWNGELLYVEGFIYRSVYEWELSKIQSSREAAAAGKQLQDQRFLHLKFFTFHHSTPPSKAIGVCGAPDVEVFDQVLAEFLQFLTGALKKTSRESAHSTARLPGPAP
ncbi:hypothetical protein EDC04DRAFT_2912396 [Pisolithus marmoratus]|nr:hypothetical protein EDC04DRAFT_2912396 [Pisolithus marmoratus]